MMYSTTQSIVWALQCSHRTTELIQWLALDALIEEEDEHIEDRCQGTSSNNTIEGTERKTGMLFNDHVDVRVTAAMMILNAIRESCQIFLVGTSSSVEQTAYEAAYPPLEPSNTNTRNQKSSSHTQPRVSRGTHNAVNGGTTNTIGNQPSRPHGANPEPYHKTTVSVPNPKKPKRRIRPATVPLPTSASSPIGIMEVRGNLIGLPSVEPLPIKGQHPHWPPNARIPVSPPPIPPQRHVLPQSVHQLARPHSCKVTTENDMNNNTVVNPQPVEDLTTVVELACLVDVYCTLLDQCLVPASILELNFLFRLLAASQSQKIEKIVMKKDTAFQFILSSQQRCLFFAAEAIKRQSYRLRGLGIPLWKELTRCQLVRARVPTLIDELEQLLELKTAYASGYSMPSMGGGSALLTIPFNEQRDSRHNYRSKEEQELYKNRENTRDAFLSQLRQFLNVRGKQVDAKQVERAIGVVQVASRQIIQGLMDVNLPWFAEFFCDLLLQIGLIPLEETDKELLSIADKEKLQKLHLRFSAKSASSQKTFAIDPNRTATRLAKEEAQLLFSGHEEFFFHFLLSADSFSFGIYLRSHLIVRIFRTTTFAEAVLLEKSLMELQMMARFLGILVFSPNWQVGEIETLRDMTLEALDGLHQLKHSGLDLEVILTEAWHHSRSLVLTVPWVVGLLRMAAWDRVTQRGDTYKTILSIIRDIQIEQTSLARRQDVAIDSVLVAQCIEVFFCDVVGLAKLSDVWYQSKRKVTSCKIDSQQSMCILSATALYICVPYLEELISLVSGLSHPDLSQGRSPGVSRKLRPSVLSTSPDLVDFKEPSPSNGPEHAVKAKLIDSFFHQHPDVKEICEFAVAKIVRSFNYAFFQRIFDKLLQDRSNQDSSREVDQEEMKSRFMQDSVASMQTKLVDETKRVLLALAPARADDGVCDIATVLAADVGIQHGMVIAEQFIVRNEKFSDPIDNDNKTGKKLFSEDGKNKIGEPSFSIKRCLESTAKAILKLANAIKVTDTLQLENITSITEELVQALQNLDAHVGTELPPESSMRVFFEAVLTLDQHSSTYLQRIASTAVFPSEAEVRLHGSHLSMYFGISMLVQKWSERGSSKLKEQCKDPLWLQKAILLSLRFFETPGLASNLWKDAIRARFVRDPLLQDCCRIVYTSYGIPGAIDLISSLVEGNLISP